MKYLVIFEQGVASWGAYVPDLPGCVAVAETREEVSGLIREAIAFHLDGLIEDGSLIPNPYSHAKLVEIGAD